MKIVVLHAARQLPSWLIFDVRQRMTSARIKAYLLAAVVAYVVGRLLGYLLHPTLVGMEEAATTPVEALFASAVGPVLIELPNSIVSAIWLYIAANPGSPHRLLWSAVGFVFQILGVALFFAVTAYERVSAPEPNKSLEPTPGSVTPRATSSRSK